MQEDNHGRACRKAWLGQLANIAATMPPSMRLIPAFAGADIDIERH